MGDQRLALFPEQGDQAAVFPDQSVDPGGFGVEEGGDGFLGGEGGSGILRLEKSFLDKYVCIAPVANLVSSG